MVWVVNETAILEKTWHYRPMMMEETLFNATVTKALNLRATG